jgi:hypothetical protein
LYALESRLRSIGRVSQVDGPSQLLVVFTAWLVAVATVPAIIGHGAAFPFPGLFFIAAALVLVAVLVGRVRHVERVLANGKRTLGVVRRLRVAGALTYVTCDLPERIEVTLAYVTRNIDLDAIRVGRAVAVGHPPAQPRRAVVLDLYA